MVIDSWVKNRWYNHASSQCCALWMLILDAIIAVSISTAVTWVEMSCCVLCVVKLVRQKLVWQTCTEHPEGRCAIFSVCLSPFNDDGCMGVFCVGVSLWKCSWTRRHCSPPLAAVCMGVCSEVCATSVLDQQSCCYPINCAAAGHAGATQRTLGNSRFQGGHFHSTASLQLAAPFTVCKRERNCMDIANKVFDDRLWLKND